MAFAMAHGSRLYLPDEVTALAKRQWTVRYLLFPLAVGCAAWVVGFLELYIAYLKYEKKGWSHRA